MTRRWAPFAAAAAVVALVSVIGLVADRPNDPEAPAAVAPAAGASSTPASAPDTPVASGEPSVAALPSPGRSASPGSSKPVPPPPSPAPRPSTAPSTAPPPTPGPGRAALAFDAAYGTDDPSEVIVQYGDSSSCPHENVTKTVRESADSVVVALTADAQPPERACTADYRQMLVPVALARPLGTRRVIDASSGRDVPVDRSCSRPFQEPPPPKDCTS